MSNKIALVTGASRGIGRETVQQLAQLGIEVLFGVRDLAVGAEIEAELKKQGLNVSALKLDVCSESDRAAVFNFIAERYGRLDILVNNAGAVPEGWSPGCNFESLSLDLLKETFEINFFSMFALTQKLLPLLRKSSAARIVNVGSKLGSLALHVEPTSSIYDNKTVAYDTSKTAVNALTVHLAYLLKDSPIKVNTAHPGWVKTEMGGPEAPMSIQDGAKTSVWLATLPADGPTGGYFHMHEPLPW